MARLILKWRYLKAGASGKHSENLIQYIARREGVEKIDDSWKHRPVTKAQKELIAQILSDYPDAKNSFEYQDYAKTHSAGAASEFISRAIEDKVDLIGKRENYVEYIAKRPRVERQGAHGLFTDNGVPINLSAAAKEVADHQGVVFTEILSLRREDAVRLGYDKGDAWRSLLRSQTDAMAEAMKIPLADLRWYAAFHNESHHPHVHIVAYSAGREPYMTEQGLHKLKSAFAREIFKQDLLQVYAEQTNRRNELTQRSRDALSDIIERINAGSDDNPVITDLLVKLSKQMKHHKGKKVYGYLPQAGRNIVNAVVDELAKQEEISLLYDLWYGQRDTVTGTYQDAPEQRVPLSRNKAFKAIKNAVIQESLNILYDRITFEEPVSGPEEAAPEEPDMAEPEEPSEETSAPKNKWNDPDDPLYQYRKAKAYLDKDSPLYDPQEAVRWLELSAGHGYEYAQYRLGKLYLTGDGVERDVEYGLRRLWQAEHQNNPFAQYLLGKVYLNGELTGQDIPQAERLFEIASDQGNSYAKYSLAKMHLAGLAVESDEHKAVRLLRESADGGNPWAQYLLGKFCFRGEHTTQDIHEAERLLTSSAVQKNSQAQYMLAKLYLCGQGIPKDAQKALHWLRESADGGNPYAQYQLGKMLLFGQEIRQNVSEGLRLLEVSAAQGNTYAERVMRSFYRNANASVGMASIRLLSQLARMLDDQIRGEDDGRRLLAERKLRRKIAEKMELHGQKRG